jgi:hypothetical protein
MQKIGQHAASWISDLGGGGTVFRMELMFSTRSRPVILSIAPFRLNRS